MAKSLEISEREVQSDHLHPKRFHSVKRLRKSVQQIQRSFVSEKSLKKMRKKKKKKETKNAWQSLAYSPLGAAVSPVASSREPKPCFHLANVQKMHVLW